jgi:hypothetical protein
MTASRDGNHGNLLRYKFLHAGDPDALTSCMSCIWSLTGYSNSGHSCSNPIWCSVFDSTVSQKPDMWLTLYAQKSRVMFFREFWFCWWDFSLWERTIVKRTSPISFARQWASAGARPRIEPGAGAYIFLDRCGNKWATGPKLSKPKGLACSNYNCGRAIPYLPCLPYLMADSSRFSYLVRGWDLYRGAA